MNALLDRAIVAVGNTSRVTVSTVTQTVMPVARKATLRKYAAARTTIGRIHLVETGSQDVPIK